MELTLTGDNFYCHGLFIHQDSYLELLQLSDLHLKLHMSNANLRELPLQEHTMMIISYSASDAVKHIGLKAKVLVRELLYSPKHGFLCAIVKLKKNYTCHRIPFILLAKDPNLEFNTIIKILNGELPLRDVGQLNHFKFEEPLYVKGIIANLAAITHPIDTPDTTHTNDAIKITTQQEFYQECPVLKGPRGGKYILKEGRKIYVPS